MDLNINKKTKVQHFVMVLIMGTEKWSKSCFCKTACAEAGGRGRASGGVALLPITIDYVGARRPIAIEQQTKHEWLRVLTK